MSDSDLDALHVLINSYNTYAIDNIVDSFIN